MRDRPPVELRVVGARNLVHDVAEGISAQDGAELIRTSEVEDPASLDLGISEIADIVTIVGAPATVYTLASLLHSAIQKHRSTVMIQTPRGEVQIEARGDLTAEEVKEAVESLLKEGHDSGRS